MKLPKSFRTGALNKRRGKLLTILIYRGAMSKNQSKIGYIKLYRSSVENDMYFEEPFTRWQAWQDLILLANHKDAVAVIRGRAIDMKRGQLAYAVKTLAYRWKWSRPKVDRFLETLEKCAQIVHQKNSLTTIITIINWDKYQSDVHETCTKRASNVHRQEVKEYNIINNIIETRAKSFQNEVAKFVGQYPKTTLRAFFDYWTEKNATGKKMKFELQKTFEVSKRLATWASRETGFKPVQKQAAHTNYLPAN
jgi:hypothetical protein